MVNAVTELEQIKQMAKALRLTLISEDLEMMIHEADEAKMSHREFLMHIFSDAHLQPGVETTKHSSHQNGRYGRSFPNAKDIGRF